MSRRSRLAAILATAMALVTARLAAAPQDWPPVTDEEMALKDCPQQPGAPAVFLYREEITNHNDLTQSFYYRLKILTSAGKTRANIEIPYFKGAWKVAGLKARVVHPDGVVVPFAGEMFEKTAVRSGNFRVTVKTFALPDVDVGCIIDYRCQLVYDLYGDSSDKGAATVANLMGFQGKPWEGGMDNEEGLLFRPIMTWVLQTDLFTRKAKFAYEPSQAYERRLAQLGQGHAGMGLSYVTRKVQGVKPVRNKGRYEVELENIPAFEPEEQMPPETMQRMEVRLFYIDGTMVSPEIYWKTESANWQMGVEKFMRKAGDAAAEARKLAAGVEDPLAKLKALYARAQEIRNLSYERTLTAQRYKELKFKDNRSVADVLKNNYGWRSDITRTFAALAAAAGYDAKVVRVATRDDKFFDMNLCGLYDQFDTELVIIQVNGRDQFYDPATPYCPPGFVQWKCTGTTCLVPSTDPPSFIDTPAYPPDKALTQREVALRLDSEGNITGTVKITYLGLEAMVRRLKHLGDDAVEIKKDLEAEMSEALPAGATAALKGIENMATNADRITAVFDVTLPGIPATAGQRILLPVFFAAGGVRQPFKHAQRRYPVYFPYARREFDDIVLSLPPGMRVESVPNPRSGASEDLNYSLSCVVEDGTKIHAQRDLIIKKFFFTLSQYNALKTFFDQVRSGEEELVVLTTDKK